MAESIVFTSTLTGEVRRFNALHGKEGGEDYWVAPVGAASPVVVVRGGVPDSEGSVYAGTVHGTVVRLSFETGEVIGELALTDPAVDRYVRSLAYSDGVLYGILDSGTLCACSVADGPLWQVDPDGEISNWLGGPVVADGLVYVAGVGGVFAFHPDGTAAWSQPGVAAENVTPAVAGGVVYTVSFEGAFALDAEDGAILWQTGLAASEKHFALGIAAAGGRVFVNGDTALHALDAATGAQLWTAELGPDVSDPGVSGGGDTVLVCARAGDGKKYLHSLDAADGSIRWTSDAPLGAEGELERVTRAVVSVGPVGHAFVTSHDGHVYAFALSDGWLAWKARINHTGKSVYPLEAVASEDPPPLPYPPQANASGCLGLLLAPWRAFRRGS